MSVTSSTIEEDLRDSLEGEIKCDEETRTAYSTAACIYKIRPVAVALPKTIDDIQNVVRYCYDRRIPLIPRGGASSLAGQAVGFGIVLDCSKYFKNIIEFDEENDWVSVEPGVNLDELNKELERHGKFFPPDPASGNQCVIGGMIGTNASGAHGLKYGSTKDYVLSLTVVLPDGRVEEIESIVETPTIEAAPGSEPQETSKDGSLSQLLKQNKGLIKFRYPKVKKNSSGYNLLDAVVGDRLDLTKLFVGSEGTLGVIVGAKLRMADAPKTRAAGLAYFQDHEKMTEAILAALSLDPAAAELMDKTLLDLAIGRDPLVEKFIVPDAQALVLFEFEANSQEEADGNLWELRSLLEDKLRLASDFRTRPEGLGDLWKVRKEATHILESVWGRSKKASFIEDVTVPPEALSEYLRKLSSILQSHRIGFSLYGHAGVGNVHCEPFLDLRDAGHRELLDVISRDVFEAAISLGGTLSGEHGDGFVRTPFLEALYGQDVYSLFRRVKEHFDPHDIMNPGKIVGPQGTTIAHDLKID